MAISNKQAAFAREYVVDLNAAAAAERVGYSLKSARTMGSRLLQMPAVAAEVQKLQAEAAARNALSVDWVLDRLKTIAEAGEKSEHVRALELLGKQLGMFRDKVDVEHSGNITVILDRDEADL